MAKALALTFDELLSRKNLKPQYQPIVDLATGEQLAAEALARWPGLDMTPERASRWAAQQGRLAGLDEACRNTAIDDVVAHTPPPHFELFVNLEPSSIGPATASRLLSRAGGHVGLVVEITERALLHRPGASPCRPPTAGFGLCHRPRRRGRLPDSLSLLPFVGPDVIKLEVSLVQRRPNLERATIYTAVAAYGEAAFYGSTGNIRLTKPVVGMSPTRVVAVGS